MVTDMDGDRISGDWARGSLPFLVLTVLSRGTAHGYAIAQALAAAEIAEVKGGALYPVLNKLESEGAVTATWAAGEGGPGRKVFELTDDGRRRLHDLRIEWSRFHSVVTTLTDNLDERTVR